MKQAILLSLLLTASVTVFGQVKKPTKQVTQVSPSIEIKSEKYNTIDTVYIIHNADINRIYNLLQVGLNGVQTSDNYSVNQRKQFQIEFQKIDSVFRPQILKWYPPIKKKQ